MATPPRPIYPITQYDVFRRMPDLGFLDPSDVSFNQHTQKMLAFAGDKDPEEVWVDFFRHTDGRTVLEWIAGISAYKQYAELMGIREGGLSTALSINGVVEQAFNKGFLIAPGVGGKMQLTITKEGLPYNVSRGTIIGSVSNYFLIADESKTIIGTDTLRCLVGFQDVISSSISGMPKYKKYVFQPTGKYVSEDQEVLAVDGVAIELDEVHDPDRSNETNYMLRRYVNGLIVVYSGNGLVGYHKPGATQIEYSCISYDDDLADKITQQPQIDEPLILESWQVLTYPSGSLTREEIRAAATFYSPDGKIVRDENYVSHIIKYFGGLVHDVVSYNTDPDQEVVILKSPNFGTGTAELNNMNNIANSINNRRGMGIRINYYLKEPGEGVIWRPVFYVDQRKLTVDLQNKVDLFLNSRVLKMFLSETTITSMRLATELSSLFNVQITPDDPDDQIVIPFLGYFSSFTADLRVEAGS